MTSDYQAFVDSFPDKDSWLAKKTINFMEYRELSSLMGNDLYEFFGAKAPISKTKFYLLRNALIRFVEFTNDPDKDKVIKRISQVTQVQLAKLIDDRQSTYKDLDEVLSLLNQIAKENGLNSSDATPLQAIAILIWIDLSDIEIINFKTSDIDKIEQLDDRYKEILRTYSSLKYFRALPSGRVQNLVQSDYLFRTANTNKLTEGDLRKIISKINSIVASYNKSFTRSVLRRSAVFSRIYKQYQLGISKDIIRANFGQSKKAAEINKLIIEYNKWAEQL